MNERQPRFQVPLRRPHRPLLKRRDLSPVRATKISQKMKLEDQMRLQCGGPARLYLGNDVVMTLADGQNGVILTQKSGDTFSVKITTLEDKTKEYKCKMTSGEGQLLYQSNNKS